MFIIIHLIVVFNHPHAHTYHLSLLQHHHPLLLFILCITSKVTLYSFSTINGAYIIIIIIIIITTVIIIIIIIIITEIIIIIIETTIWSSSFRIPADKSIVAKYVTSGVPVGHPISATTFILIAEDGKEVTASDGEGWC